jgi:hypothetical protein
MMLACLSFIHYILDGSCVLDDEDIILRYATLWIYENLLPHRLYRQGNLFPLVKVLCIVSL